MFYVWGFPLVPIKCPPEQFTHKNLTVFEKIAKTEKLKSKTVLMSRI